MAENNGEKKGREVIPGTRLVEYDKFYAHLDLPKRADGRNIPLFKTVFDREMSPEEWEEIVQCYLQGKEAPELEGFIGKKEAFSSRLEIRKEANGELVVRFPIRNKGLELPSSRCPKSGEPMTKHTSTGDSGKTITYFRAPGFLKLTLWGEHRGRAMSAGDWRKVLEGALKGEAGPEFSGFKRADGSTYSMRLIVSERDGKYVIERFKEERALKYERHATGVRCPITKEEILDSGKYLYSPAYPKLLFPKELRGKKFSPEDFVANLSAWSKGEKGPSYSFVSRDGTSQYEARLQMDEKQHYVNLDYAVKYGSDTTQATAPDGARQVRSLDQSHKDGNVLEGADNP